MPRYRWGILATGGIAQSMAEALCAHPDADLIAVASRKQSSADAFGDRWKIPHRYASYAALMEDTEVDIVYIATPHPLHYENMRQAFAAKKHVLCEKPLAMNVREAAECRDLAQQQQCFLMEAVWMRFFPAIQQAHQWVKEELVGEPQLLRANFSFHRALDPAHRLFNLALGGGTLLDMGVYPLSLAIMLFGAPTRVSGEAIMGSTGVDEVNALVTRHAKNCLGLLSTSMRIDMPNLAKISGSKGHITIQSSFLHPDRLSLQQEGKGKKEYHLPYIGNGYAHEINEVHDCLNRKALESTIMPLSDSMAMLGIMDALRAEWGLVYPTEP